MATTTGASAPWGAISPDARSRWLVALALLAVVGCRAGPPGEKGSDAPRTVVRVGDTRFDERDLELRVAHDRVYYPDQADRERSVARLILGALAAEISRRLGEPISDAELEQEAARVELASKDPERLARIKAVYGSDRTRYLRVGLLPDHARSRLGAKYGSSELPAEPARRRVLELLEGVDSAPHEFAAKARGAGLQVSRVEVSAAGELRPLGAGDDSPPVPSSAGRQLMTHLGVLPEGAVHPRTLETAADVYAARLLRRHADGRVEVELARAAKQSFDEWFWRHAQAVEVELASAPWRRALEQRLSWFSRLKLSAAAER